jgi:hypothetical protein
VADDQFITTTQEVEIITETPAEVQLVETSAEETYSFTTSESSASVIETELPVEVVLETDEADPQIIQIETAGPQGAPGEKGEKGDKGDPGDPGLLPGNAGGISSDTMLKRSHGFRKGQPSPSQNSRRSLTSQTPFRTPTHRDRTIRIFPA